MTSVNEREMESVEEVIVDNEFDNIEEMSTKKSSTIDKKSKVSLYETYQQSRKKIIIAVTSGIALLTPFSDTIYLPALTSIQQDFQTSQTLTSLTVSLYLAMVAIGQLVFGPFSDRYGRIPVIHISLVLFELATIGCILSPSIAWLIALRSIEGFFVSGSIVSAQAMIADVFEESERGSAMGSTLAPMLIGPIIAPLIGGALAQSSGWRSTFIFLAAMAVPIVGITCLVPETHHFFRNKYLAAKEKKSFSTDDVSTIEKAPVERQLTRHWSGYIPNEIPTPDLLMPWESLVYAVDIRLSPYYAVVGTTFGTMFSSLTILPLFLAVSPYNLSESITGVTFLPVGVGMLLGSIVGGMTSDYSAARFNADVNADARMTLILPLALLVPIAAIGYGFALQYGTNLSAVLIAHTILGFSQAVLMPSTLGYLSSVYPTMAGALGSVMLFLCFGISAIIITVSVPIYNAIGIGQFFVILGGVNAVCILVAMILNYLRMFDPIQRDGRDASLQVNGIDNVETTEKDTNSVAV